MRRTSPSTFLRAPPQIINNRNGSRAVVAITLGVCFDARRMHDRAVDAGGIHVAQRLVDQIRRRAVRRHALPLVQRWICASMIGIVRSSVASI